MQRLLFVCTGNICRSPTAEAVFRYKVVACGLAERFFIDSAGTQGYHVGDLPDHRSIATAKNRGIDMANLSARKFSAQDLHDFDYIFALDKGHYAHMERMMPKEGRAKLVMFLEHHPLRKGECVPDPYYGDQAGFDHVYDLIEQGSDGLLKYILESGAATT